MTTAAAATGAMKILPTAAQTDESQRVLALADTPEARQLKVKLAAGYRLLAKYGLDQGIAGHVSLRVPGAPGYFWVNPFGLQFSQVTADKLALISEQGELLGGWPLVNYAAFCIHAAIHRARPDVNCAAHTHSPSGSAFSALNIPLEPLDQVSCSFFEDHAVYSEYDGVVADLDQTRGMVDALADKRGLILANHGLVTCAATVEQAIIDMLDFDRSCNINLRAMATGRKLQLVPPAAARQARRLQTTPTRWPFQWPCLMMELGQMLGDCDPQGWLPAEEIPNAERLRAALARSQISRQR